MKQRFVMTLAALFFILGGAIAQTTATGVVTNAEDGQPIIGASVKVVGTRAGAVTDINGTYSVSVPSAKSKLEISYVGMVSKVITAGHNVQTSLMPDAANLDEVIVVAYGTQKKTSLTGAIQSVKAEEIEMRPTSSVASALEGTVSGVQINSTYGSPGEDPSIRIRGIGTVNGSTSPLYVVDGVPFGGNISDLNPADIESMSVLKDAASAALYGNRASNGVILIQTKKGKTGKLNVSLDIKQGTYSRGIPEYDRLNTTQWMEAQYQNLKNAMLSTNKAYTTNAANFNALLGEAKDYAGKNVIADIVKLNIYNKADNQLFDANGKLVGDAQIKNGYLDDLDWFDQATRNGYRQEYNFNANGANEKADYLFSMGYLSEDGYLRDSGYDRITARVAANIQPKKWFKAGLNVNASHQNFLTTNGGSDASYTNVFMYAREVAPVYPVHLHDIETGNYILDANGNKRYDGGSYYYTVNPDGSKSYYQDKVDNIPADAQQVTTRVQMQDRHVMWENELNEDKTVRNTINGTAYADFILPYGFTFTLKGNLNVRTSSNQTYDSAIIGDGKGNDGRGKRVDYRYKNYTFQQQLHWAREFGIHSVDALIGHENYHYAYNYLYGYKTSETFAGINNLNNFNEITNLYDYNNEYATESYLGRVRYAYSDRYNVEASFRRDGSSRFHKDARWGNFWSLGANWIISNENFMKNAEWVNYLKLRADYGEVGNDAGAGYYGYMALYESTQHANQGAYYISQLSNYDLKWETGQSWGVGIDARLFNRWNISAEYFDKRNKDLLFDVYLPLSAGGTGTSSAESVITQNIGVISNRGVEISTDVDIFKNKDWRINFGTNITFLKNKVITLPEQNREKGIISGTKLIMEGKDRYAFWTYTWEGIDTYNGQSLYKFNDGDNQGKAYRFEQDGKQFGNWEKDDEGEYIAELMTADQVKDNIVIIDGVPHTYNTTYAKKEFHGSALPTAYGSFNLSASWKGLSLYTLFTYQLGGKVLEYNYQSLMGAGSAASANHLDVLNSWTTDDKTAEHTINPAGIPVFDYNLTSNNNATSSRWFKSASYLVLKNITLSYSFPKSWMKKIDLTGIALNVTCENLVTFTSFKGMNPQQTFDGTQYNYLTTPRVFSVGLNVKF